MKITSVDELQKVAVHLVSRLVPKLHAATLVTLSGNLGVGKTTFAQMVAKELGVTEDVTSPTFVIEKVYPLEEQLFKRLIHIDAYRLESSHELEVLGFAELLKDGGALILFEWPEKVQDLIPENAINLRFDIHGDERTISFNGKEKLYEISF